MLKKTILLSIIAILVSVQLNSQSEIYKSIEEYKEREIPPEFDKVIKEQDRRNFKRLREFLSEKENLRSALEREVSLSEDVTDIRTELKQAMDVLETTLRESSTDSVEFTVLWQENLSDLIYYNFIIEPSFIAIIDAAESIDGRKIKISKVDVNTIKDGLDRELRLVDNAKKKYDTLLKNLQYVREDIYKSQSQIDSALAPEYKQQEFRIYISICFSLLIALLLLMFFYIVYKKSDINLSKELLSDNGLQFVTLFVLIIAIILFGILGILEGSELAAILSGISGYILGKGTGWTKAE